MKLCYQCDLTLPFTSFHKRTRAKDGLAPYCKTCVKSWRKILYDRSSAKSQSAAKLYRQQNPTKVKLWNKAAYQRFKEQPIKYRRSIKMKDRYGMTEEDRDRLITSQNNLCPICEETLPEDRRISVIDHNHKTGQVRGVVHQRCNLLIGLQEVLNDKSILRQNINQYITKWRV